MTHENITASAAAAREAARSSDGKFGTQPLDEADIVLMPLSERLTNPIDVQSGDLDHGFPDVVDATVMDSVSIHRDYDGSLTATGTRGFRYSDWAPGDPEDEEAREAWGERHQAVVDTVIEQRYPGTQVDSDGDEAKVRFEYDLGAGPVTEQDVIDKMSNGAAVDFYNESDDGPHSTENLSRIIRERVQRSVVVENPYDRDAQDYIRTLRTSGMVHEAPLLGRVQRRLPGAAEVRHPRVGRPGEADRGARRRPRRVVPGGRRLPVHACLAAEAGAPGLSRPGRNERAPSR